MNESVLLVRPAGNDADAAALAELGIATTIEPYLRVHPVSQSADALKLVHRCDGAAAGDWLVVTSSSTVLALHELVGQHAWAQALIRAQRAGMRVAAVGPSTAALLVADGAEHVLIPQVSSAYELCQELESEQVTSVLFPCGTKALSTVRQWAEQAQVNFESFVVYETTVVDQQPQSASALASGAISAVVLRSPSAVEAITAWGTPHRTVRIVCAGATTAAAAQAAGLKVSAISNDASSRAVAQAVAQALGARQPPD